MRKINPERVADLLSGLAKIGTNDGQGVTRLAYSDHDRAAQLWLLKQIEFLNLEITEDAVGNVFLRRPGLNPDLPPVATGSCYSWRSL